MPGTQPRTESPGASGHHVPSTGTWPHSLLSNLPARDTTTKEKRHEYVLSVWRLTLIQPWPRNSKVWKRKNIQLQNTKSGTRFNSTWKISKAQFMPLGKGDSESYHLLFVCLWKVPIPSMLPARCSIVLFGHSVMSDSSRPHGLQHQASLSFTISQSFSNSGPQSWWCHK